MGEKEKKGGKREEKKEIVVREGKHPYFVSLFNIGTNVRQKI